MWTQYLGSLIHFTISVGMGYVLAATAWLYADASRMSKSPRDLLRISSLLVLAVGYVLGGVEPQGVGWAGSVVGLTYIPLAVTICKLIGFSGIIASLILEPLQDLPYTAAVALIDGVVKHVSFLLPVFAAAVGLLYWRRAVIGLEAHVRRLAVVFWGLGVYELFHCLQSWYPTTSASLWHLIAPFGVVWWSGQLIFAAVMVTLGRWVFGYLLKQFTTQLFLIFSGSFLTIFLIVTAGYTGTLLSKLRSEALHQVNTSLNVLMYAFEEQQSRLLSEAVLMSEDPQLVEGLTEGNNPQVAAAMSAVVQGKRISQAVVVDGTGKVIWRSDQGDRTGEIWPDILTVNRLMKGETTRTIVGNAAGGLSTVSLLAAAPIESGEKVVGGVIMSLMVDPILLTGIKTATGLEAAVFHKTNLVATSITDTVSGIEEKRPQIIDPVLKEGKTYQGGLEFLSTPYLAVFKPLTDSDHATVGMLFGGRPESEIMASAAYSLEMTFYGTALIMLISLFPAWYIARSIARQVR